MYLNVDIRFYVSRFLGSIQDYDYYIDNMDSIYYSMYTTGLFPSQVAHTTGTQLKILL